MNFQEWYKYFSAGNPDPSSYSKYKTGWYSCLVEVIKILEEHPNLNKKTSLDKAFEKIKKL